MTPGLVVRAEAAADIEDAHAWHERARPGLEEEFVIACFHAKRDPLVWQSRR